MRTLWVAGTIYIVKIIQVGLLPALTDGCYPELPLAAIIALGWWLGPWAGVIAGLLLGTMIEWQFMTPMFLYVGIYLIAGLLAGFGRKILPVKTLPYVLLGVGFILLEILQAMVQILHGMPKGMAVAIWHQFLPSLLWTMLFGGLMIWGMGKWTRPLRERLGIDHGQYKRLV